MEEVIDELRERNEPVPVALELPDEETLVEIQEQILIHLPFALREFLLTVSDVVYGHLEPVTASDPHSHTYLPEVTATAWDLGLPRHLVPVCHDAPIYYAVDEDGEVFAWDSDSQEMLEDTWESVWHWARDVWLES
ncbi:MAG: SMI1/KNR4 family protein [Thiopseudomonas sp.]|uniref:SMI1/KNR4 family protein n=1 Tax=Denitrificimonas caeni TaxID=521720 RepID=UPI0003B50F5B|nr:SMI1/KNR4 family protein [Denitrificimonas caeni]MBO6228514.1 SMI1/KNR4 family protein [Shewanella sp.]MBP7188688.1 SMI1/KNR4 family protein [Thiopseudomonas sp.]HAB93047.1 SMI1/KNR4 family protein [Pseudomonas sp.]MBP7997290.1 SMI1/KNR4 family protein [Thiopseudomonas sp.]MBP8007738.1 SMI1/KNR4 family protein [Thiopseudomonas sp.]